MPFDLPAGSTLVVVSRIMTIIHLVAIAPLHASQVVCSYISVPPYPSQYLCTPLDLLLSSERLELPLWLELLCDPCDLCESLDLLYSSLSLRLFLDDLPSFEAPCRMWPMP